LSRPGSWWGVRVATGRPPNADDALTSGGPLVSDSPDRDAAMALARTADARIQAAVAG
jgi:hypothetical protein